MAALRALLALTLLTLSSAFGEVLQPVAPNTHRKNPLLTRHLPFAGNGTCGEPTHDEAAGTTTVTCLGPAHWLSAGQTIDTMMLLETPFPKDRSVVVVEQTSQLVADNLRPVPLSELYLHHYGGGAAFVMGSGAEVRGSFIRKRLPEPYAIVVNGSEVAKPLQRMTNIQLINTLGLPEDRKKACLECWCDHDPWNTDPIQGRPLTEPRHDKGDPTRNGSHPDTLLGSLLCCHQCASDTPIAGPFAYHLQYTVTYRDMKPDENIKPVKALFFDVVDGDIEYQLTQAKGPGSTHVQSLETIFAPGPNCSTVEEMEIVRCLGHQHFGGQCITMYESDTNAVICQTCPSFGKQPGVPGDEEGYVVAIPDDDLALDGRTYKIKPGTRVRLESVYDASVPRFGIMGLLGAFVTNLPDGCQIPIGGNGKNDVYLSDPQQAASVPRYGWMFGMPVQSSRGNVLTA